MQKLVMPTGYEGEQQRAKTLRSLAEAMAATSTSTAPVGSWTQVLAQILQGYVAGRENKKADALDTDVSTKMQNAFNTTHQQFTADAATMTPEQLQAKYGSNPYAGDDLKPYVEGITARQRKMAENSQTMVDTPDHGYQPLPTQIGRVPFDPNKTVVSTDNGQSFGVNPVKITADRLAQANGPAISAVNSMAAPGMAPQMPAPAAGGMDLSLLKPEERQILAQELARRANGSQVGDPATVLNNTHIPMGSPLSAAKVPDGVTLDGRPYWNINGVPYDNPEGK